MKKTVTVFDDKKGLANRGGQDNKQVAANGQIVGIKRNFGKLPLIEVLGKAVIRQLSEKAKNEE